MSTVPLEQRIHANALRVLAMDMVQAANSGHPGAPMGMADLAEVLWREFLRVDPAEPTWLNRDRFVLSNGHASALLYALLHLSGFALPLQELRRFRQWGSQTPGHPEFAHTPGVETSTGPLGQGLANAVGMALAEKTLAARFNTPEAAVIDHRTWVFLGDGCLMEGISHEVCSLAGTLGLGKLIAVYDDNGISIDGEVDGWFTDNTAQRFAAYGWQVIGPIDGHDPEAIRAAYRLACTEGTQPRLIIARTVIGLGSPNKEGKEDCHGSALGVEEVQRVRQRLNWHWEPFVIPEAVYAAWDRHAEGAQHRQRWSAVWERFARQHAERAGELRALLNVMPGSELVEQFQRSIQEIWRKAPVLASRKASQLAIEALGKISPSLLFGGSADLAGSNLTLWSGARPVQKDPAGNYVHYGVREFGMAAMLNGIALHGGFIPFGATFLVFVDYEKNALRMAALMRLRVIHVLTHDSIGLGEDGPTHQPVEQLSSLRLTPGLSTWRPADATETLIAWKLALLRQGPTALVLSRQNLVAVVPNQPGTEHFLQDIERGGYVLRDAAKAPDTILLATGSEVELALAAQEQLQLLGYAVRVVSLPSCDTFLAQSAQWQEAVLPTAVRRRVAIEAASGDYWFRFVGLDGAVIGMQTYGASAPAADLYAQFGITVEAVVAAVKAL